MSAIFPTLNALDKDRISKSVKQKTPLLPVLVFITAFAYHIPAGANKTEFVYESEGEAYRYSVVQSGDNYNFEFEKSPENTIEQFKAGIHVIETLYTDTSINLNNRKGYIRERAKCSLFKGSFYDYTLCIFPNDFSSNKQDVFRGYVTQLPNWKWMVTRILTPVLLVFGLIFFLTKTRKNP